MPPESRSIAALLESVAPGSPVSVEIEDDDAATVWRGTYEGLDVDGCALFYELQSEDGTVLLPDVTRIPPHRIRAFAATEADNG